MRVIKALKNKHGMTDIRTYRAYLKHAAISSYSMLPILPPRHSKHSAAAP